MRTIQTHSRLENSGRSGAFTIIEIMLAIGIFMMVIIAIYAAWSSILRGSRIGLDAAADAQRLRVAMRAIEESLTSAQFVPQNHRYYAFLADTSKEFAALSFVSQLSASFPGSGLFGSQNRRRVTFVAEPGPDSPAQLLLKQTPLLEPADATGEPYSIVLIPNLRRFQIEFWDPVNDDWMDEWTYTNQMPRLVRIVLSLRRAEGGSSRDEPIYERIIAPASVVARGPRTAP